MEHTLTPTYRPQANGLAEQSVQTFNKNALSKMNSDKSDRSTLSQKIARFLMWYRSTPHATTNSTPAELFLKRQICTPIAFVHPSTASHVLSKQEAQKHYYDSYHKTVRNFLPNQKVFVRSHKNQQWCQGVLINLKGNTTWYVNVNGKKYLELTLIS